MPATQIPLTFRLAPLPMGFVGTPQQLATAIVARLSAVSANTISFFASGSVAPTSNVGPWLKNDQTWYVWSDTLATYIPQVVEPASLGYTFSQSAPDQTIFKVWYKLDGSNNPIGIFIYANGSWQDVYASQFAAAASFLAANYSTTTVMNAAIAAAKQEAIDAGANTYPVIATTFGNQAVTVDGNNYVVSYPLAAENPDSVYDTTTSKYVAPITGIYQVAAYVQVDNLTGSNTTMECSFSSYINGIQTGNVAGGVAVKDPPGQRRYPQASGFVRLNAGDGLQMVFQANDGINTGSVNLSNGYFCISLIKRI